AAILRIIAAVTAHIATTAGAPVEIARGLRIDAGRRNLPFIFRRQSLPRPTAIRFGLIPTNVDDRMVWFQRYPSIEVAAHPTALRILLPVSRMICVDALTPRPAFAAPEFAALVSVVCHKSGEFDLRRR